MHKFRQIFCLFSLAILLFSTCACNGQDTKKNVSASHKANAVKIMPLGDSITQSDSTHNSYRRKLWKKLQSEGYNVDFVGSQTNHNLWATPPDPDFDLDHEGHWGWRADQILEKIDKWAGSYLPDIALIHLGHNDIFHGNSVQSTVSELEQIIDILRRHNAKVTVLLAQLIPTHPQSLSIQELNAKITELAESKSTLTSPVIVVNQWKGFDAPSDTYDGVHPNESGEEKMATRWYEAIAKILQKQQRDL
jgi:acyl-CoA thioesterase-1